MTENNKNTGFTRRDFVKTVGIAGLAVAGTGVTGALSQAISEVLKEMGTE